MKCVKQNCLVVGAVIWLIAISIAVARQDLPKNDLDQIYIPLYKNLGHLRRLADNMKKNPNPSLFRPLVRALDNHYAQMNQTYVGPQPEVNKELAIELYSPALEILQGTVEFYVKGYGRYSIPSDSILILAIRECLIGDRSPFAQRHFEGRLAKLGKPLYLVASDSKLTERIRSKALPETPYKIKCVDKSEVPFLLTEEGVMPTLNIELVYEYERCWFIEYQVLFRVADGPQFLDNIRFACLVLTDENGDMKTLFWRLYGQG